MDEFWEFYNGKIDAFEKENEEYKSKDVDVVFTGQMCELHDVFVANDNFKELKNKKLKLTTNGSLKMNNP